MSREDACDYTFQSVKSGLKELKGLHAVNYNVMEKQKIQVTNSAAEIASLQTTYRQTKERLENELKSFKQESRVQINKLVTDLQDKEADVRKKTKLALKLALKLCLEQLHNYRGDVARCRDAVEATGYEASLMSRVIKEGLSKDISRLKPVLKLIAAIPQKEKRVPLYEALLGELVLTSNVESSRNMLNFVYDVDRLSKQDDLAQPELDKIKSVAARARQLALPVVSSLANLLSDPKQDHVLAQGNVLVFNYFLPDIINSAKIGSDDLKNMQFLERSISYSTKLSGALALFEKCKQSDCSGIKVQLDAMLDTLKSYYQKYEYVDHDDPDMKSKLARLASIGDPTQTAA